MVKIFIVAYKMLIYYRISFSLSFEGIAFTADTPYNIQSAKILLVHSKSEIIFDGQVVHFSNIAIAILDFSLLLSLKLLFLMFYAYFLSKFFALIALSIVINLPTIATAIVVAL